MMKEKIEQLIFYRPDPGSILSGLASAVDGGEVCCQANRLISLSGSLGLSGNLWQNYLTWYLAGHENPFTLGRERTRAEADSMSRLAAADIKVFAELFRWRGEGLPRADVFEALLDFRDSAPRREPELGCAGEVLAPLVKALADAGTAEEFLAVLTEHYAVRGVGLLGMNGTFRVNTDGEKLCLEPVRSKRRTQFADIIGYDAQKRALMRNTDAFLAGKPANNVLLYGDSGTGKSTCIKAMETACESRGLRLIEIYKHQFRRLSEIMAMLRHRNYRFVLFIDDLSFEDNEVEYKFLKAVIEGGADTRPENVLVYATSNRRHLIRETWRDKNDMEHDGDVHRSDTVEEKLSLASRFGVAVNFSAPDASRYRAIVEELAAREGITLTEEELVRQADAWEIRHGGRTGRAARQFIDYLLGE